MTTEIAEFKQSEAALTLLRDRYTEIPDFTTKEGYESGRQGIAELRTLRTSLDKARKRLNEGDQARIKFRNTEAKRITGELVLLEDPLKIAKGEVDMIAEREAEAVRKVEEQRISAIEFRIGEMTASETTHAGMSVDTIDGILQALDTCYEGFDFQEFSEAAGLELDRVRSILLKAMKTRKDFDQEQADLAVEREALEKSKEEQRVIQEEAERKIEVQVAAFAKELQAQKEEIAEQQRKVDEDRQEAARVMQEAQDKAQAIKDEEGNKERLRIGAEAREARRPDMEKTLDWAKKLRFIDGPDSVLDDRCLNVVSDVLEKINDISLEAIKQLEEI